MQKSWKVKFFFLGLILLGVFAGSLAFSQPTDLPLELDYPNIPGVPPLEGEPSLPEFVRYLYNFSIIIAGLIAFFSLIYGGFRYLTSVGSPVAMSDARDQVSAGIIGLIILLASYLMLTILNPQLIFFNLEKPDIPTIDIVVPDIDVTVVTTYLEIPLGELIEEVLDEEILRSIKDAATEAKRLSGGEDNEASVKNRAEKLVDLLNRCSCGDTDPNASNCTWSLLCPATGCTGEPCPNRDDINTKRKELRTASDLLREFTDKPFLSIYISYQKRVRRLEIARELFKEALYPINYDNFLELKQVTIEAGGDMVIVPFFALGRIIKPKGDDPATFYISEGEFQHLGGAGLQFPPPEANMLPTCNECEIPLDVTDIDIDDSVKEELASEFPTGGINIECVGPLGTMDCWDYVIVWAKANSWNPAFILSLWGEEGGFDQDGLSCPPDGGNCVVLGCDPYRIGDGTSPYTRNLIGQLECFADTVDPSSGNCQPNNPASQCYEDNTDFCGFMRCWSSDPTRCTLSNNPNFFPVLFNLYNRIIPPKSPAAPSGNCTKFTPLPPGAAGCPLNPGFQINCGWAGYTLGSYVHDGIDLNAVNGDPVYAVADGTIYAKARADLSKGLGIYIELHTEFGIFKYGHLQSTVISIGSNVFVKKGAYIGEADDTGHSEGPHLHLVFLEGGAEAQPVECLGIECIDEAEDFSKNFGCDPFFLGSCFLP